VKVADTVTGLFGMVRAHGLVEEVPEQDAPVALQPENDHPEAGAAVREIDEATASEHPLGQLGVTVPEPDPTFVVKVWVA